MYLLQWDNENSTDIHIVCLILNTKIHNTHTQCQKGIILGNVRVHVIFVLSIY